MMRFILSLLIISILFPAASSSAEKTIKRVVVVLYDSPGGAKEKHTRAFQLAAMPLNHLGLIVWFHNVRKGLPTDDLMAKAHGIMTWFSSPVFKRPGPYLNWLQKQQAAGKRLVIFGHFGVNRSSLISRYNQQVYDLTFARIGIRWRDRWISLTHATQVIKNDTRFYDFERKLPPILPAYPVLRAVGDNIRVFLTVRDRDQNISSDLVIAGPKGGYIAAGYAAFLSPDNGTPRRAWYVNPFRYFAIAFGTDHLPKPDTTTLSGRRAYYSHIDGDAWHSLTRIEKYLDKPTEVAEVVYNEILRGYPDLPTTVGPITADLDPSWYGNEGAIELARKMFRLPNVEAGSHTHSHPFAWAFFKNPGPDGEKPYLNRYPTRPGKSLRDSIWDPSALGGSKTSPTATDGKATLSRYYSRPRAYAVRRFDLGLDITGSIRLMNEKILPPGDKVRVLLWSGNTEPFAKAMKLTRAAGVRNLNGGDPRMDGSFRSYAWVSPLARHVGNSWQIYTSGSNENIYTAGWTKRHSSYRLVIDTFRNIGRPIRLKPINIYYHFYIAERSDSFNALRAALDYARRENIAPITASRFAASVDGFLSARIIDLGNGRWRIENRDGLETIRFDNATTRTVDFSRSSGIVGQRYAQGSLYIALDSANLNPVIALKNNLATDRMPVARRPYLIESRWKVFNLSTTKFGLSFSAQGFGNGEFRWKMPIAGRYKIVAAGTNKESQVLTKATGNGSVLSFNLKTIDTKMRKIRIGLVEAAQ